MKKRPRELAGETWVLNSGQGKLVVITNQLDGEPFEVFVTVGHSGTSYCSLTEAIGRLISLALRSKVPVEEIIDQLRGISEGGQFYSEGEKLLSIPDAVGFVIEQVRRRTLLLGNAEQKPPTPPLPKETHEVSSVDKVDDPCPECGTNLVRSEGCERCPRCPYSRCG